MHRLARYAAALLLCSAAITGCGPDFRASANRLREQNVKLDSENQQLKEQVRQRDGRIADLQAKVDNQTPRIETLPDARLSQLYTAARIQIQSTTDSWQFEADQPASGFRVFIRVLSDDSTIIPATGSLTLEAFELPPAPAQPVRLASKTFSAEEMKKSWFSGFGLNHFAFNLPWETKPTSADVTFKAVFVDALTGRRMETQLNKRVRITP